MTLDKMNKKRTHYCGEITKNEIGNEITVCGFTAKQRDLGQLIFIDLRDRTGIIQLAFDENCDKMVFEKAFAVRSEWVLMATGVLRLRSSVNTEIPTGELELLVNDLRVLSKSETPPFEITANSKVNEELRLKHRYLDLRRPDITANIMMRHKICKVTRDYYSENGFLEIETPMMMKSTPEGARDYLVPSRLYNGEFYALPQSPQIYKQLLMVSGFDRYFQLARCFRDEDLRADRQPEFTQIDLEMSFVDMDDVLSVNEGYIATLFKEVLDITIPLPLPRMTYADAMNKYGSDKPDTRYEMLIEDISETVKDCEFVVFKNAIENGGTVRMLCAKSAADTYTRKEIDRLTEHAKGIGAKGLAWIRITEEGTTSSFQKFMSEEEMSAIISKADAKTGDVIIIVADKTKTTLSVLGSLRTVMAEKLNLCDNKQYNFLWITEFPFFEYDEEKETYVAMHHPFTSPLDECIELLDKDKSKVLAKAYDLVINGIELSSGSIRITDPVLQNKMFAALGLSQEEAEEKFGFLTGAFKYGAPPHGGMGIGLDRLCMIMAGAESLRDIIAFPKMQNARELMSGTPANVDKAQLDDLGIVVK